MHVSCGTLAYVAPEVLDPNPQSFAQIVNDFEIIWTRSIRNCLAKTRGHFYKLSRTEHPSWKDTSKRSRIVHPSNGWSSSQRSPHICRVIVRAYNTDIWGLLAFRGLTYWLFTILHVVQCCSHFGDETWSMDANGHQSTLVKRSWRRHTQASATFGALECLGHSELSRVSSCSKHFNFYHFVRFWWFLCL